mmetsp:Transcript_152812/g.281726  ORF Transcript_152812/g.281726 Transcript_152812/m.281726 type:complete len:348 (-) Transcript_152812:88-1131(-)
MCSIAIVLLASVACAIHGQEEHLDSREAECTGLPSEGLLMGGERVMMQQKKNHANRNAMVTDQMSNGTKVQLHSKTDAIPSTVIMMSEQAFMGTDGILAGTSNPPKFLVPDVPCSATDTGNPPAGCTEIATIIRSASSPAMCLTMAGCAASGSPTLGDCSAPSACDQWYVFPSWGYADGQQSYRMRKGRITWAKDPTKCLGLQGKGGMALSQPGNPVLLEACDDENPNAWEQQWTLFPDFRMPSGMGTAVSSTSMFKDLGMGACLKADGTSTAIGWAPCTCLSTPCTAASGDCLTVDGCADDCMANADCAAFGYYDNHCWLFGGKTGGSVYTQTASTFNWYSCYAKL